MTRRASTLTIKCQGGVRAVGARMYTPTTFKPTKEAGEGEEGDTESIQTREYRRSWVEQKTFAGVSDSIPRGRQGRCCKLTRFFFLFFIVSPFGMAYLES